MSRLNQLWIPRRKTANHFGFELRTECCSSRIWSNQIEKTTDSPLLTWIWSTSFTVIPGSRFCMGMDVCESEGIADIKVVQVVCLVAVCEIQWDTVSHSPAWGRTMNFETNQSVSKSVSDVHKSRFVSA